MPNGTLVVRHPYNDTVRFEKVAEVFKGGYAWALACVFRDKLSGRLYGDADSGCSCYGPFDEEFGSLSPGFTGPGALTEISHERDAAALLDYVADDDGADSAVTTTERRDFCNAVRAALSAQRN